MNAQFRLCRIVIWIDANCTWIFDGRDYKHRRARCRKDDAVIWKWYPLGLSRSFYISTTMHRTITRCGFNRNLVRMVLASNKNYIVSTAMVTHFWIPIAIGNRQLDSVLFQQAKLDSCISVINLCKWQPLSKAPLPASWAHNGKTRPDKRVHVMYGEDKNETRLCDVI